MVTTRRSRKSSEAAKNEDAPSSKEQQATTTATTKEEESPSSPTPTKRSGRKKRQKEELKSKNTGVGLSIAINNDESAKKNKKIIFDEDVPIDEGDLEETAGIDKKDQEKEGDDEVEVTASKEEEEEDEDDAVEEVKGSAAREEILQQLEAEEKGALKTKKRKKRKDRATEVPDDDDDDLDDDFFAQLETAKAEEQTKKESETKKKKKGKHTTFVFGENDKGGRADPSAPKKVGHNIQVVVLPDEEETFMEDAITAVPATALSEEALLYSRSSLQDGADKKAGKRKKNAPVLPDTSWKRSRKMSLVMTPTSRFNRRGGRGRPAANFASNSKR